MPTPVPSSLAMLSPHGVYTPHPAHTSSPFVHMLGVQEGLGGMHIREGGMTRGDACKGKGCTQGEGEGPGGMHARGRATHKGRGRVCK